MTQQPPTTTLFPYTTLFRSKRQTIALREIIEAPEFIHSPSKLTLAMGRDLHGRIRVTELAAMRSEEHTSELQSHHDLVCRLLLEKKKKSKWLRDAIN